MSTCPETLLAEEELAQTPLPMRTTNSPKLGDDTRAHKLTMAQAEQQTSTAREQPECNRRTRTKTKAKNATDEQRPRKQGSTTRRARDGNRATADSRAKQRQVPKEACNKRGDKARNNTQQTTKKGHPSQRPDTPTKTRRTSANKQQKNEDRHIHSQPTEDEETPAESTRLHNTNGREQ